MKYITRKQKITIGLVALFVVVIYGSVFLFPTNNPLYGFFSGATIALIALPFMVVGSIIGGKNREALRSAPQGKRAEIVSSQNNASLRRQHVILTLIVAFVTLMPTAAMFSMMGRMDQHTVVAGEGDMLLFVPIVLLLAVVLVVRQIVLSCRRTPRYLVLTSLSTVALLIAIITFIAAWTHPY